MTPAPRKWLDSLENDCQMPTSLIDKPLHSGILRRRYPVQWQPDQLQQSSLIHRMSTTQQPAIQDSATPGSILTQRWERARTDKVPADEFGPSAWKLTKPFRGYPQPRLVIQDPYG